MIFIGSGPLVIQKGAAGASAAATRSWHLLAWLLRAGIVPEAIVLLTPPDKVASVCDLSSTFCVTLTQEDFLPFPELRDVRIHIIDKTQKRRVAAFVQKLVGQKPVIAVNTEAAVLVSRLRNCGPTWFDLNGWMVSEGLAHAQKIQNDFPLLRLIWQERRLVACGDFFSVVSDPQKYALMGEMALAGRWNHKSSVASTVSVIQNAVDSQTEEQLMQAFPLSDQLRAVTAVFGSRVPRYLLTAGVHNAWIDEKGVEEQLAVLFDRDPEIRYVVAGEGLAGLSQGAYLAFRARLEQRFGDRVLFLGRVDKTLFYGLYRSAFAFLHMDLLVEETLFGARNRLNESVQLGTPPLVTAGSQIADALLAHGAALEIVRTDPQSLFAAMQLLSQCRQSVIDAGQAMLPLWSFEHTTRDLCQWARCPRHAPGGEYRARFRLSDFFRFVRQYLDEKGKK